jgi:hypothetical protein
MATLTVKQIENKCEKAYEHGGLSEVCDLVLEKFSDDTRITWEYCTGCECEVPSINGSCLVCGSSVE